MSTKLKVGDKVRVISNASCKAYFPIGAVGEILKVHPFTYVIQFEPHPEVKGNGIWYAVSDMLERI